MKDFKTGDRVKIKKSICEGEVVSTGHLTVCVRWDNGDNSSANTWHVKHVKANPSSIVHVDDNENKLEVDFSSDSIAIYTTSKVVLDKSNVKALRKSLKQWLDATKE